MERTAEQVRHREGVLQKKELTEPQGTGPPTHTSPAASLQPPAQCGKALTIHPGTPIVPNSITPLICKLRAGLPFYTVIFLSHPRGSKVFGPRGRMAPHLLPLAEPALLLSKAQQAPGWLPGTTGSSPTSPLPLLSFQCSPELHKLGKWADRGPTEKKKKKR